VKVTTQELERCETLVTVEVETEQLDKLLKKTAQKVSREIKIPGFRPGKAPFQVVARRVGLEALQQQMLEDEADALIAKALTDAGVKPYAQITLQEVKWEPLLLVLRVPTEPKVILGEYRHIRLETPASELVTDEDVANVLKRIQAQNATWVPVEQPSELGHSVSISVTQKDGDTVIVENQSIDYELVTVENEGETIHPQNQMTAALVGLSDGETKTFSIHYPADYEETDVAGKEITFTVEVNGVKVKEVEPIDDEFAKAMGDKDSLAEWREELKENIQQQREMKRAHEVGQQVLDKVMAELQLVEWPLSIEEQMIDQELTRQNQRLQEANLTLDAYYKMQNTTPEAWREQLRGEVAHRLKTGLVLSELAQKENVRITQTEVLERARYISQMSGLGDRIWQYILQSESYQQEIASELLADKTLLHLAKIAKGEMNESSPETIETAAVEEATPEVNHD